MFRVVGLAALCGLAACSVQKKNEKACLEYIDSLECGELDLDGMGLNEGYCGGFEDATCDITEYFDCLREGWKCEGNVLTLADNCELTACE